MPAGTPDVPRALEGIVRLQQSVQPPAYQSGGLSSALGANPMQQQPKPSYQQGGMIGPGGQPVAAGLAPQGAGQQKMSPQMLEMQIEQFANQRPQEVAQIGRAVQEGVQSGELNMQELNMLAQLAMAVLRNPALYPQVRQFAIQQGLATEQDIPPQFDEGLVFAIIIAARASQANMGGQNMMAGGQPNGMPMQSFANGGVVNGKTDAPVDIRAHEGEYVIPKHVVAMKGREFFDKLLEQYKEGGND